MSEAQMDPHKIAGIVMRWLYFKTRIRHIGYHYAENAFRQFDAPESILAQISADAGHSWLLQRMLAGYDPLPQDEYDAWKARNFEGGFAYLESRKATEAGKP